MIDLSNEDEILLKQIISRKCNSIYNTHNLMSNLNLGSVTTESLKKELLYREISQSKRVDVEHHKNSTIHFELIDSKIHINVGCSNYFLDEDTLNKLQILFGLLQSQ